MWDQIQRMMPPMAAVFTDMPWEDYTILMAFSGDLPGGAALEHGTSHLGVYNSQLVGTTILASVTAHEIFHAWNVKRLRPAELVPYRYDRPQPTELLWMSEGITDYYADLALVRGGITDADGFYRTTARKIRSVAGSPPVALEDASVSTWIEPTDGTAFIYYDKGSLVGLLLDILIRDASDNSRSLDDVMRDLYRATYLNGRGFTHIEFWQAVGRATRQRSFADFYAMYVDGTEGFAWDEMLPLAGLRLLGDTTYVARIGVLTRDVDSTGAMVSGVTPRSMAGEAGVVAGDVLVRAGEIEVTNRRFGAAFRRRYAAEPEGTPVTLTVRRNGELVELTGALAFDQRISYRVEEDPDASAKAIEVRTGILTGS
jgi:predicted metalloprotease with PDZ domain